MIRLYFNSSATGERPWSVDHGEGTPEETVNSVIISECDADTRLDKDAPSGRPTGWIEVKGSILSIEQVGDQRIATIA